ncbi:GNAT family N-acetyltransferase [Halomonas salifodinae]|uniref:GNAT family N-acetyltransferase n=1 Tax=Halomonas salifodinae TaxID=438745 RepID=A0ABW2ESP7_9GAMM
MEIAQTPRLRLRELDNGDVPALAAILADPEVMRYSLGGVHDEAQTRRFIAWCRASYAEHGLGPWALVDTASGELAGFCGLSHDTIDGVQEVHLGYRLATRFWGRGLATEAARWAVALGFTAHRLASLVAIIEPAHGASRRVVEKVGFRDAAPAAFHGRQVRVYRLTASAWGAPEPGSGIASL